MKRYYILTCFLLITFHIVVVAPVSKENKRLNATYRTKSQQLQVARHKLSRYDQIKSDWLSKKGDFNDINRILPDESQSLASFRKELKKNAEQSGVVFSMNHNRAADKTDYGFYSHEFYTVSLEGSVDSIHLFVRDLSESTRIIDVVEWSWFLNPADKALYHSELILKTVSFIEPKRGRRKGKRKKK